MAVWQDHENYSDTAEYQSFHWAWEFLRRNPDYQKDFAEALKRFQNKTGEFDESVPAASVLEQGGTVEHYHREWNEDPSHPAFYLPVDERDKWQLTIGMFNPECPRPRFLGFRLEFGVVRTVGKTIQSHFSPAGVTFPWAVFNLELPLAPQLKRAKQTLRQLQTIRGLKPRRVKLHKRLWPHYLRLLDADLDSRTPKQIADHLCAEYEHDGLDERQVWDQLQAARAMTKPEGYSKIFLSPSQPIGK